MNTLQIFYTKLYQTSLDKILSHSLIKMMTLILENQISTMINS